MNALLNFLGKLGEELVRLLPSFFAYLAGKERQKQKYQKDQNAVLKEDNQALRDDLGMSDDDLAASLRERAKRKRADENKD